MPKFHERMSQVVISLLALGAWVYGLMVFAYATGIHGFAFMDRNPAMTVGLPVSAVAAFGIPYLYGVRTGEAENRQLGFEAFGLEFSGPAGPVSLWVICYLAMAASMRLLS